MSIITWISNPIISNSNESTTHYLSTEDCPLTIVNNKKVTFNTKVMIENHPYHYETEDGQYYCIKLDEHRVAIYEVFVNIIQELRLTLKDISDDELREIVES